MRIARKYDCSVLALRSYGNIFSKTVKQLVFFTNLWYYYHVQSAVKRLGFLRIAHFYEKKGLLYMEKKKLKIAIIILAVLLVLSGGGLAARYIYLQYFAPAQATATVPDNLIGDSDRTDADGTPAENTPPAGSGPDGEQ